MKLDNLFSEIILIHDMGNLRHVTWWSVAPQLVAFPSESITCGSIPEFCRPMLLHWNTDCYTFEDPVSVTLLLALLERTADTLWGVVWEGGMSCWTWICIMQLRDWRQQNSRQDPSDFYEHSIRREKSYPRRLFCYSLDMRSRPSPQVGNGSDKIEKWCNSLW